MRRVGGFEVGLRGARSDPGLDGLDLGDVAGDAYLGVVLRPRLSATLGAGAFLLLGFASAAFGLALCAGFRHGPLPGLFVRGVVPAPATELAQLDSVRRITPRLVGLIIPPLAIFASQRHRDADISASHLSPQQVPCPKALVTKENLGPKPEAWTRIARSPSLGGKPLSGGRSPAVRRA